MRPELAFAMSLRPRARRRRASRVGGRTAYAHPRRSPRAPGVRPRRRRSRASASRPASTDTDSRRRSSPIASRRRCRDSVDRARISSRPRRRARVPARRRPARVDHRPTHDPRRRPRGGDRRRALPRARRSTPDGRFRYLVDAPTNQHPPAATTGRATRARRISSRRPRRCRTTAARGRARFARRAPARPRDAHLRRAPMHRRGRVDRRRLDGARAARVRRDRRHGLDSSYRRGRPELTAFLRTQQRPDGEFMHVYDRGAAAPHRRAAPLLHRRGRARAVARAHRVDATMHAISTRRRARSPTSSARAGASSATATTSAKSTGPARSMDDLWDRAPDPAGARLLPALARLRPASSSTGRATRPSTPRAPSASAPSSRRASRRSGAAARPASRPSTRRRACAARLRAARAVSASERRCSTASSAARSRSSLRQQLRPGATHLFARPAGGRRRDAGERGRLAAPHRLRAARGKRDDPLAFSPARLARHDSDRGGFAALPLVGPRDAANVRTCEHQRRPRHRDRSRPARGDMRARGGKRTGRLAAGSCPLRYGAVSAAIPSEQRAKLGAQTATICQEKCWSKCFGRVTLKAVGAVHTAPR